MCGASDNPHVFTHGCLRQCAELGSSRIDKSSRNDLGDTERSLVESMRIEIRFAELKFDSLN